MVRFWFWFWAILHGTLPNGLKLLECKEDWFFQCHSHAISESRHQLFCFSKINCWTFFHWNWPKSIQRLTWTLTNCSEFLLEQILESYSINCTTLLKKITLSFKSNTVGIDWWEMDPFDPNQTIFLWLKRIMDELNEAEIWRGWKVLKESENFTIFGWSSEAKDPWPNCPFFPFPIVKTFLVELKKIVWELPQAIWEIL